MTREGDEELLTIEEARKELGVGRTTLYRMIASGEIKPVPGNPVLKVQPRYFTRSEIERVKRQGRKPKTSD